MQSHKWWVEDQQGSKWEWTNFTQLSVAFFECVFTWTIHWIIFVISWKLNYRKTTTNLGILHVNIWNWKYSQKSSVLIFVTRSNLSQIRERNEHCASGRDVPDIKAWGKVYFRCVRVKVALLGGYDFVKNLILSRKATNTTLFFSENW